ncbi:uridine phosphorylase [Heterostelium album PN500]|uniref:Uridine phosphorylase n=1 Tax=Heterostelium pallidum (strain ATCC 26659 / Pp 5 / PN500) TaxID=670386 RepID=D3B760_HETP5|nr:uridine phosphorylase [Heterostelium album PN500]EFA82603.1 uridine phosphorylase [Heterostelium album PN500]|eukprot:XP_020434720.1 uridine phosphorylase [Heterostelium album PN500]
MEKTTPICLLPVGKLPRSCVVVGDPNRAKLVAEKLLKNSRPVSMVREYHCYVGTWKDTELLVMSHGIGGGGASVCFEELIQAGITTIIRAGTAGSFDPRYREGSLVIATGAVRSDGVSEGLVPLGYPAIADHEVVQALIDSAKQIEGVNFGTGIITTVGHFFDGPLGNHNKLWARSRVLAIEMEASILFIIASLRGIRSGCCVNIDNYIFERELTEKYEPNRDVVHQGTYRMLEVALDSAKSLLATSPVPALNGTAAHQQ